MLIGMFQSRACPDCRGTGGIECSTLVAYQCTSCNGTGIAGDPRLGFWIALVFSLVSALLLTYFLL